MPTPADRRLLTERSREGDLLEHRPLARALAQAIRDTPSDESLGVALYGAWGQGKSMIGRLIEECLLENNDQRHVFVRVDAWKYAHEGEPQPLRRHYLLKAYEAAGLKTEAEKLRRAFAQKVVSQALDERSRPIEFFRNLYASFRSRWYYGAVAILGIVLLWVFFPRTIGALVLTAVGVTGAVVVAASAMLDTVLRVLTTGLTVTTEEDPFRSIEEFDDQFTKLLERDAADVDRFVFLIDDLDRCKDDLVVEAIETLQAFFGRPRCAYIVAADELQLKRAVRAKSSGPVELTNARSVIPSDETFLEKIFQVSVHVPPLYEENLATYAELISKDTAIGELPAATREDLLGYLVHPQVVSPRQVRVILNDFLVVLFEAQERERESRTYLMSARLTSDLLFLAKIVVLRSHFPWFFALLYSRPEFLIVWPETFEVPETDWSDEQREADEAIHSAAFRALQESRAFAEPVAAREQAVKDETRNSDRASESGAVDAGGGAFAELVDGLRGFLVRTSESTPEDAARVEEFLYLRGRIGFAGLTGDVGRIVRRAIQTGDVRRLEAILETGEAAPAAAADAALDRLKHGSRVDRLAARRALLAITEYLPTEDLELLSRQIVTHLYPAERVASMAEDDLQSRQRLVPWFDSVLLRTHISAAWPSHFEDAVEVLRRGAAIADPRSIVETIASDLSDEGFISSLADSIGIEPPELATAYASEASLLARKFEGATNSRSDVAFVLSSAVGRRITGTDRETGATEVYLLDSKLDFDPGDHLRQELLLDLVEIGGVWRVYRVTLARDPSQTWAAEAPTVVTEPERRGLRTLLEAVLGRAATLPVGVVMNLAGVRYASVDEALGTLAVVRTAATEHRLADAYGSLKAMLEGAGYRSNEDIANSVIDAAVDFGEDAVGQAADELLAYALGHAEYWEDDDAIAPAGAAFRRLSPYVSGDHAAAIGDSLDPGFAAGYWIRAIREFVVSVDPDVAVALIGTLLKELLEGSVSEVERSDIVAALELLEVLADVRPIDVAEVVGALSIDPGERELCGGIDPGGGEGQSRTAAQPGYRRGRRT